MNLAFYLAVFLYGTVTLAEKTRYDNYKLVHLTPLTPLHVQLVSEWEENYDFDVWTRIKTTEESVNVLLSPEAYLKYTVLFTIFKIPFDVMQDNMQRNIDEQERSMALTRNNPRIVGRYARYAEIQGFIDNLAIQNPSLVSSSIAGRSYEGRNLKVAIIKATGTRKVWLDCGIHAREWVSPATCVWIIDKLVTGYNSGDATVRGLLSKFEFHILPVVNPDGYEYSHTTTRLWRKNRRPNSPISSCFGTDLNRNWGFKWLTGGSSTEPCSDLYAGPSADSELETKAIEAYILKYKQDWATFLTVHSYGKWWFTPYGYTTALPADFNDLNAKAQIGIAGIKASGDGTGWTSGSSARILYVASGGSEDWAYGTAGIKYSYCLELRPGQSGTDASFGFTLPEDRAPKAGQETFGGIAAFLNSI